jgi:hypothetical protein
VIVIPAGAFLVQSAGRRWTNSFPDRTFQIALEVPVAHFDLIIVDAEIGSETTPNDLELSPSGFIVDA